MEIENKIRRCLQEACPVSESGKCLEGLDPENCSHAYWDIIDSNDEIEDDSNSQNGGELFRKLFDGQEMPIDNVGLVTNRFNTSLVIIIGESNSGKTTILTSLYDIFQIGGFDEHYFAGSRTQVGLETRCHLSRTASRSAVAETLKTTSKDFSFLHIAYKKCNNLDSEATHVLLSDISGERFTLANSSTMVMKEMDLVKRADHIMYLLDGEKLSNKFEKNAVITRAAQFISRALDADIFDIDTKLNIVFSKGDLLLSVDDAVVAQVKDDFQNRFGQRLKELSFLIIAARPKPPSDKFPFGFGLEDLLNLWSKKMYRPTILHSITDTSIRYFDQYQAK